MRFLFSLSSFQTARSLARNGLHCKCVRFTVVESTMSRQLRDGGRRTSRHRSTEFATAGGPPINFILFLNSGKEKKEKREGGGGVGAGCCVHLLRLAALPVPKVATSCAIFFLFFFLLCLSCYSESQLLFRRQATVSTASYSLLYAVSPDWSI